MMIGSCNYIPVSVPFRQRYRELKYKIFFVSNQIFTLCSTVSIVPNEKLK